MCLRSYAVHKRLPDRRRCQTRWGQDVTTSARRLIRFTKITVLIASTWTALCAVMLTGHQIITYLQTSEWDGHPISSVIRSQDNVTYTMASSRKIDADHLNVNQIFDWV